MDQKKTGIFLRKLRKEKKITQEQLAEELNVSGRTVSRWETGSSMPDISLLIEIADFYGVDVREIVEGERKSEMMSEDLRDVAGRMAEYAGDEKNRLLRVIRITGFGGVLVTTLSVVLQCLRYSPNLISAGAIAASFLALAAMTVITLYVAVVIENPAKKKSFAAALKIGTVVLAGLVIVFLVNLFLVLGIAFLDYNIPFREKKGIENYNKQEIVEKYGKDMDSCFMVFPETADNMLDAEFDASVRTGIFDTDGFFILKASYAEEEFRREILRLAQIRCELTYRDDAVTRKILYDEEMYRYPAYIASDGFERVYEYALIDREKNSIIYILLSYPDPEKLEPYRDYLKTEKELYEKEKNNVLENFTIYAHKFPGSDVWLKYPGRH